ncbi:TonB-like protein [Candidatus Koribacter versatilis Ellin345]|uniref:TonB-like protein n=1 Tax=Koribacter versatilis (strain Ellin345) TaxID=204669 RepID=Q1ITW9_KORVE|nr:TonB family protein [Candidatus Koribacter versatilis]ABF39681.1 TonB-like protein [Candidatus Koribacter versatilis Ellin345]
MFEPVPESPFRRRPWVLVTSMAAHCLVLFLMLRAPTPEIVKVHQLRQGDGGKSFARLYLQSDNLNDIASEAKSSNKKVTEQNIRSKQLDNPSKSLQLKLEKHERLIASTANNDATGAGKNRAAATAGSTYGSLYSGDLTGPEVRPALWISGPNPAVAASEFAEGLEGSVIVEITIDDEGNVVATHLIQGLSGPVDGRVIEALQMAHFIPAKRNGVSIPSKQDVYYHFPR